MDNLNFIEIYFKVFILKIIILKKPKLSKKEIKKNHRQRMKTCLCTRTSQKTLEGESKWHLNAKVHSASKSQFGTFGVLNDTFWSAEHHSKSAELPSCGLWPNGLRVTIMHTIFDLFTKWCIWIQTLIIRTYFLESSGLYK